MILNHYFAAEYMTHPTVSMYGCNQLFVQHTHIHEKCDIMNDTTSAQLLKSLFKVLRCKIPFCKLFVKFLTMLFCASV